jgi:2-amino-4-hydroxy-6-hydroxymethyldihydropteridine diphosphokinase
VTAQTQAFCYIAIGANLGDRFAQCEEAVARLAVLPDTTVRRRSAWYETEPVVDGMQHAAWATDDAAHWFINGVVELETSLTPIELVRRCLEIERAMGRYRIAGRLSRSIDLDLLFYGDEVLTTPELTIPHPRLHLRRFVLVPLAELAPDFIHPILHRSIAALLDRLSASGGDPHQVRQVSAAPHTT